MRQKGILFMFGLSLALMLPLSSVEAAVGVSSSELQSSANIVLPSGNGLNLLPGYSAFELDQYYHLDGGLVAEYTARLVADPYNEDEALHLKLASFAYNTQNSAVNAYVNRGGNGLWTTWMSEEQNGTVDALGMITAEYDSRHALHVSGNLLFQASLYMEERIYDSENLSTFQVVMEDASTVNALLIDAIHGTNTALALLFPPAGVDHHLKSEASSVDLSAALPENGSIHFDLYVGDVAGSVGTVLDASGLNEAVEGDLYLYIHNDGRLFAGLYSPGASSGSCAAQAGWVRLQSSSELTPYAWNRVNLDFGVGGFSLSLNGAGMSCALSDEFSAEDFYLGDYPGDGIEQSMVGHVDNFVIAPSLTASGETWDSVLASGPVFADVSLVDPDIQAIEFVKHEGIFEGIDGSFFPEERLNRAQMMKVLLEAYGYGQAYGVVDFTDVTDGAWYLGYLRRAVDIGMVKGRADGSFGPADGINRAEFYTMLARIDFYRGGYSGGFDDVSVDDWYADAAGFARAFGLIKGDWFGPSQTVTRREAAVALYSVFN